MTAAGPINDEEFARRLNALGLVPSLGPVAVAVSGGPDSMALALLAGAWGEAVAVTFDHGLRPGSEKEARQVAGWLSERDIDHHILTWQGPKPDTAIQEKARHARYAAMEAFCRERGISWLLLGHHREDQAETFLMRLARGSGVDGLAAMAPVSSPLTGDRDRPLIGRPLLDTPKARLIATLEARGQAWIDDPSNDEVQYERVRMRGLLGTLEEAGIEAAGLAESARRLRRSRAALQSMTDELLGLAAHRDEAGFVRLDRRIWADWQEDFRLRALARCLMCIGGRRTPPRTVKLESLDTELRDREGIATTLGGCLVKSADRFIDVIRESADLPSMDLPPGADMDWDGRFRLVSQADHKLGVGPLGEEGWATLPKALRADWRAREDVPFEACLALPAVFADARPVAVPHLAFSRDDDQPVAVVWDPAVPLI